MADNEADTDRTHAPQSNFSLEDEKKNLRRWKIAFSVFSLVLILTLLLTWMANR